MVMGFNVQKETKVIKGPETIPAHKLKDVLGCQPCADNLVRVAKKFRRTAENAKNAPYSPHAWITAEEMFVRCGDFLDELLEIDERLSSVLVRGDKSIQRIGIAQSVRAKRDSLDLPDALSDSLFVDCLNAICDRLLDGVNVMLPSDEEKENYVAYATFKRAANRGTGLDCAAGDDADRILQNDFLPMALEHEEGLFFRAFEVNPIVMAIRRQLSGGTIDDGVFKNKLRDSIFFPDPLKHEVVLGKQMEPEDGVQGLRVRLINNIPIVSNPPLMMANAIFMDTLLPEMKQIWKTTPLDMIGWGLDSIIHCTDFSGFENTITSEIRQHIWKRIYSQKCFDVAVHIDSLPIVSAYTDYDDEGNDITVYWKIDRFNNTELREEFSPLLSGTGDTALIGKIVGLASQLRHFLLACNLTIEEAFTMKDVSVRRHKFLEGTDDLEFFEENVSTCIASECLRNTGDDAAINFSNLSHFGYSNEKIESFAIEHESSLKRDRLFDITLEDPKKYIGMVFWYNTAENPTIAKTYAVSNDPMTLFTGRIMPEQSSESKIRGDSIIGLAGTYEAYRDTIVKGKLMSTDEFNDMFDLMLDVIDAPWTREELLELAPIREQEVLAEDDSASAALIAVRKLGFKSINELNYLVDKSDVASLPPEIIDKLWIPIPSELAKNVRKYINV